MTVVNHATHVFSRRTMMLGGIAVAACATVGISRKAIAETLIAQPEGTAALDFAHAHISDYMISL